MEVDFFFHRWYYFLVFKLDHLSPHKALNYYCKFLPDEALSSHLCSDSRHCLSAPDVSSSPTRFSVAPCSRICISSCPPRSVWMLTRINFITHLFCILFLTRLQWTDLLFVCARAHLWCEASPCVCVCTCARAVCLRCEASPKTVGRQQVPEG